jgi:ABC-type transport system substrate-binding protein/tetratricopeptide (TPR) repeat protein
MFSTAYFHVPPPIAARRWALGLAVLGALAAWHISASRGACQDGGLSFAGEDADIPLFEQEPYDEIVLDDEDKTVVRVMPLDLPDRRVPDKDTLKRNAKLIAKKLDDPTEEYEILWKDIAEVRLFEQMVLKQAVDLVDAAKTDPRKFDEAFAYFDFLKHQYPKTKDLDASLEEYLYEDAGHWHQQGTYENALVLLDELYRLNPKHPKLETALGATMQKIAEEMVSQDDYPGARQMMARLNKKFPKHPAIAQLEGQWSDEASKLLASAREQAAAGKLREAWDASLRVLYVYPKVRDLKPFMNDLYSKYPRVSVGVSLPAGKSPADRLFDWAVRRSGRLLNRRLVEFKNPGANGGVYVCPFGPVALTDIGRRLEFQLRQGIRWSGGEQLTGFDIARRLLSLADRGLPGSDPDWAELFGGVEVLDVFNVSVDLRWTHVQPLALLDTPLASGLDGELAATVGPYALLERVDGRTNYTANDGYFDAQPGEPQEIIERRFDESGEALHAMHAGEIQVIDRLRPWEVEKFRSQPDVVVEEYSLPTVHCLLPNRAHPFTGHRSFRRALVYGIDREKILNELLLRGAERKGCQLVSGPFPIGTGLDDPLRYAYNTEVAVRPWNFRLSLALSGIALHDVAEAAKKKKEPEITAIPPLVLAYPAHEPARIACTAIQRHLKAVQIPLTLRELEPGQAFPPDDKYDLVYAELTMQEPLVDAARLLGPEGIAGGATPYMVLALRQLSAAAGWSAARKKLQQIHQLCDDDTAVIPLWQLTEFFAYHRSLEGIGSRPVALYQNVEQWRGQFQFPRETP